MYVCWGPGSRPFAPDYGPALVTIYIPFVVDGYILVIVNRNNTTGRKFNAEGFPPRLSYVYPRHRSMPTVTLGLG